MTVVALIGEVKVLLTSAEVEYWLLPGVTWGLPGRFSGWFWGAGGQWVQRIALVTAVVSAVLE